LPFRASRRGARGWAGCLPRRGYRVSSILQNLGSYHTRQLLHQRFSPRMLFTIERFRVRADVFFFFLGEILARQNKHGKIRRAWATAPLGEQFEATHLG